MERLRALVVGGGSDAGDSIRRVLSQCEIETRSVSGREEMIEELSSGPVGILFVDFSSPEVEPVELARLALAQEPSPVVVGLRAGDEARSTSDFIRAGGFDVITAPPVPAELTLLAERARRELEQLSELQRLRTALRRREGYDWLVGRSDAMQRLRDRLESLATGSDTVWISGESGTGKELTARAIHGSSLRSALPFVVVGCAELDTDAATSRWLFDAGAPSDPFRDAGGGTLYLEEVGALPIERQEGLLSTLSRWTAQDDDAAGVRLISGTTGEAARLVERGSLHEMLYRRLSATRIALPRLRERAEDIPLLARHFVASIVRINRLDPMQITPDALHRLQAYDWPGNVQELRSAIEHAVILASDGALRVRDLPDWVRATHAEPAAPVSGSGEAVRRFREAKREVVDTFERAYLSALLEHHNGNVTSAAGEAGMLRSALQRLLRKHGLKSVSFRTSRPTPQRRAESEKLGLD